MDTSIPPRPYNSAKRRTKARETRRRILDVAEHLFAEAGYGAVTMDAIAQDAGVSVATVYLHFSGKAAIVEAIADVVVASPELSVERILETSDPIEQLRLGASIMRVLNERSSVITDILRSAHGHDESLEVLWRNWKVRHLYAMRTAANDLARKQVLRRGLTADDAADLLYALAGPEFYRELVHERGWQAQQYEEWLFRLTAAALLE